MKLKDKITIITGGAKGIGFGCASVFARRGSHIVIADRDDEGGRDAVRQIASSGGQATFRRCDVTDESDMESLVENTVTEQGRLDCIVNNAGWHPPSVTIGQTSVADFEAQLRMNLTSTFMGCKFAIPHLRRTGGTIVIIASEVAVIGQADACAYVASKAGQVGLTRALALDLITDGVRVNAVCPSNVRTPLMTEWASSLPDPQDALRQVAATQPDGIIATIEQIGEICAFLASDESSYITGQTIIADRGAMLGYGIKAKSS